MCMVLCLLLLLFKFSYAIIADIYSLTHFRFSVCKALDPGLPSPIYTHRNSRGGNQRDWDDEASSPLRTRSFPVRRLAVGATLHKDKSHYFAITISWHIFGSGQKCSPSVIKVKTGGLCMCAWVQARLREERDSWAFTFVSQEIDAPLFFEVVWSLTVPHRRQREHLSYALIISGIVTIDKIFYIWQSSMRCFCTVRGLPAMAGALLLHTHVAGNCCSLCV